MRETIDSCSRYIYRYLHKQHDSYGASSSNNRKYHSNSVAGIHHIRSHKNGLLVSTLFKTVSTSKKSSVIYTELNSDSVANLVIVTSQRLVNYRLRFRILWSQNLNWIRLFCKAMRQQLATPSILYISSCFSSGRCVGKFTICNVRTSLFFAISTG